MKRIILFVLVLFFTFISLYAQQGEYRRKSVSSLGYTWYADNAYRRAYDETFFAALVDEYIEIERFDFNVLPAAANRDFQREMNRLNTFDLDEFASVLERTVGKIISDILSDPEVQEARSSNLKDESARISLASTKGREYGLTEVELELLMNSAYVYFPYIRHAGWEREENKITYEISGGIIWYQVQIDPNGKVKMVNVESTPIGGSGSSMANSEKYESFTLAGKSYKTSAHEHAMYSGMQNWINNLSIIMRSIPDFALTAQILERKSRTRYTSSLGRKDGVYIDDTFHVAEYFEDKDGKIDKKIIGYGRLIKNVDDRGGITPDHYSEVRMHWGKRIMPGAQLEEYPLLGVETNVAPYRFIGMKIPKEAFEMNGYMPEKEDRDWYGIGANFSLNMAPIIGYTQTYIDLDISGTILLTPYDKINGYHTKESLDMFYSIYAGMSKKYWVGRNGLDLGLKLGVDIYGSDLMFNDNDDYDSSNFEVDHTYMSRVGTFGTKLEAKYLYMIKPNLLLNLGASRTFSLGTIAAVQRYNDEDTVDIPKNKLKGLSLGHNRFFVGLTFLHKSMKSNPFRGMESAKNH